MWVQIDRWIRKKMLTPNVPRVLGAGYAVRVRRYLKQGIILPKAMRLGTGCKADWISYKGWDRSGNVRPGVRGGFRALCGGEI
jgi:hypothetical protein